MGYIHIRVVYGSENILCLSAFRWCHSCIMKTEFRFRKPGLKVIWCLQAPDWGYYRLGLVYWLWPVQTPPIMKINECQYLHCMVHIKAFLRALNCSLSRSSLVNISDTLGFSEMCRTYILLQWTESWMWFLWRLRCLIPFVVRYYDHSMQALLILQYLLGRERSIWDRFERTCWRCCIILVDLLVSFTSAL